MNTKPIFLFAILMIALMGCQKSPEPLEVSGVVEIQATVIDVDAPARTLVLRGPEGKEVGLNVGPKVRNLAQVSVGDTLTVSYYSGYLFSMAEPGNAGTDAEIVAGRTEEGALPGAVVGETMRATVEILSVARDGSAVSFRDPQGATQSVDVQREEVQAFARKLRQGDLVDIHYTEAVAVAVESVSSGG